ncbi:MAG: 3-deoxy-D-manno-octulosonic acid transferase [Flavobacteriaceae bacterium]|nr:3-deoxy-D-manno-octulosonic acid transferase [Flavobacteriaceae bacterium]
MRLIYNLLTHVSTFIIWCSQFFNKKMKLFVSGRKDVFKTLSSLSKNDKTIWFHCASLGEFEQGKPIIEEVKTLFPNHKIIITFFSPSGFEIKKNTPLADYVTYLPVDTIHNARKFIEIVNPSIALFVKYEFWPNYLFQLKKNNIPTLLISGIFRPNQLFFKWYGSFMRKGLQTFHHFFVQDETSKTLLDSINLKNVTVSGDTRFDRVHQQLRQENQLDFIETFKQDSLCLVCGSTWPEDDEVLLNFINQSNDSIKIIIAPHNINAAKIESFRNKIIKQSVLFSEKEEKDVSQYSVFFIDTIGILTKIYNYADIAYIGGAMGKTGLHNILEAATFGIPIVIGKHFENFPEAIELQKMNGLYSVKNESECNKILSKLIKNNEFRKTTGTIAKDYVESNIGATEKTMNYIKKLK